MNCLLSFAMVAVFVFAFARAAVSEPGDIIEQGLYSKSDHVVILARSNFDRKVYNQNHGIIVQFYNSFCGHCRAFAPKYKSLAAEIVPWNTIVQLAVIDCSVEENTQLCRQFEIMAYPSLRYLHVNYQKANGNVGERLPPTETAEQLKTQIVSKLQSEQALGRLRQAPPLSIASYTTFVSAMSDLPNDIIYAFLVFENENSTVGPELILDTNDYRGVRVKRVHENCELAVVAGVTHFPGLVVVKNTLEHTPLTPRTPTASSLLNAINTYLKSKNYIFPIRETDSTEQPDEGYTGRALPADVVYYADLEKTIKTALTTEITRYNSVSGEKLQALLNFLGVLVNIFPFRGNGREYVMELRDTLLTKPQWSGSDIYDLVKQLESKHYPVYTSNLEYIGCRGSSVKYRGYSCGLWTLFHTLTVNAAQLPGNEGPKVLQAMHGYIKNFFGCTECAEHFQAMAARNRLFDVQENDKAVLWLWISHNEVNLRLAGDVTEDPLHPKQQFPMPSRCKECRLSRGAWNLPAVYQYLQRIYAAGNIRVRAASAAAPVAIPFSSLDLGMLSLLYILSFLLLILVIKIFLTKRLYRKKVYRHDGRGKV